MKNHKGDVRGFYHRSEAWYGPANLQNSTYTDEVTFGLFCPDGGTSGEMGMRWKELGGKIVPQLQVFDDGWSALASFPDLIKELGKIDDQNISPKEFCALLTKLGFTDRTPRKNPHPDYPAQPTREELLKQALIEAYAWIPRIGTRSPLQRGAKCETLSDVDELISKALGGK